MARGEAAVEQRDRGQATMASAGDKPVPEGWDSVDYGEAPPVARRSPERAAPVSGQHKAEEAPVVAVTIDSATVRDPIASVLHEGLVKVCGPEGVAEAMLVIAEQASDVPRQIAAIRKAARHDAAILLVLAKPSPQNVASAHAAGAFACLRPPIVPEELLALVTAALDSRAARVQVAHLERELNLQEHLASIGRMSAGLAHEIGGPLSAAALNMEVIRTESARLGSLIEWLTRASPEELPKRVESVRTQLEKTDATQSLALAIDDTIAAHGRLKSVLTMMRGLVGRVREPRRERVELLRVFEDTLAALGDEVRGVEIELVGDPVAAVADEGLLSHVLRNLTSNAARAARSLSSPRVRLHAYASGDCAVASVRDNGPGIPGDLHEKIFEPFFTTHREEGGTGLGLAMCREYAVQMGAELALWSVPGRGSCFRIFLPLAR
jgi:two-component system NtrC family sensor kinase